MRMPLTAGRSAAAGDAGDSAASGGAELTRPGSRALAAGLRRHWLISVLLLAGLVLRVLAEIAYRPALLYIDSLKYLYGAWPGNDPMGYNVVLKGLLLAGNLESVAAIQHLLGLAMGLTLYLVLGRRGVPRWLAALAAAPVLLDSYQVQIEQTIMPDVWFEACIVAGLALLLWRPRPGPRLIVAGGLLLGLSAPFAQVGQILILPALLFVLIVVRGWRRKLVQGAALCVAFAIPIVGFSMREYVVNGHFSLAPAAGNTIYGRLAYSADCATLKLPSYERALCPPRALALRLGPDGLVHNPASPDKTYVAPPGKTHAQMTDNFDHQVLVQQPLRVVAGILGDSVKLFAVPRRTSPGDTPISRWQFQTGYPTYGTSIFLAHDGTIKVGLHYAASGGPTVVQTLTPSWGGQAQVARPLASFLRSYQLGGGYTPGPLLALAAVFGLIGSLGVLRRRRPVPDGSMPDVQRQLSLACLLVSGTAVAVLLASDAFEFSWRYQLPALVTLPPAGALGIALVIAALRRNRPVVAEAGPSGPRAVDAQAVGAQAVSAQAVSAQAGGDPRPGEAQPGEAQPGEARPGKARPGEARPGEAQPGETRPGEARPGEARPGEAQPGDARPEPGEAGPREAGPGGSQLNGAQPGAPPAHQQDDGPQVRK